MMNSANLPSFDDVRAAARRIATHARRTPVAVSSDLDEAFDRRFFFKCENLQETGSFKFRGALNAVLSLTEQEARHGVATHSSGNHGAALAKAALGRKIPAHIVMPENASPTKIANVRRFSGIIHFCRATQASREAELARVMEETGATLVHPFNDARIIAGQGTAATELLEEVGLLDVVFAPVGGGGLLSGTSIATAALSPAAAIVGAEPAGADDAFRSLATGAIQPSLNPRTKADGLLTSLGELTFAILRRHVKEIVTVTEEEIDEAMALIQRTLNMGIEPSSAVAVAAATKFPCRAGSKVGVILSGGNVERGA